MEPSERFIRFNGAKLLLLFAPLACLVVVSMLVDFEPWRHGPLWVDLAFAGVVLFLVIACLVFPRRLFVHLTPEGLTVQYLANRRSFSWDEISNFRVVEGPKIYHMPTGRRVVFDLAEDSPHWSTALRLAAVINRYDFCIISCLDVSADELASMLNAWQQHYARRPGCIAFNGYDNL